MSDVFTRSKRSAVMSRIRSAGNKGTELRLIAIFRTQGVAGWRRGATLQFKVKSGKFKVRPDFVFRARKLAVFVDGCFWHGCPRHFNQPRNHAAFWRKKVAANRARDRLVTRTLRQLGWKVLRIWEHELSRKNEARLSRRLASWMGRSA